MSSVLQTFFTPKRRIISIGITHLLILAYQLYSTIENIIFKSEPFSTTEGIISLLVHLIVQILLITFLSVGATKNKPNYVLPWLIWTFPIFSIISIYIIKYSNVNYFSQLIVNIIFIGVFWCMWLNVFKFYRSPAKN